VEPPGLIARLPSAQPAAGPAAPTSRRSVSASGSWSTRSAYGVDA